MIFIKLIKLYYHYAMMKFWHLSAKGMKILSFDETKPNTFKVAFDRFEMHYKKFQLVYKP